MTTKTRRSFTDEFKQETVALLESSGRPLGQIAMELGIQRLYHEHRERYGSPRIHIALGEEGWTVSRGRVARVMRHHGIQAKQRRAFRVRTTDRNHDLPVAPNLLNRQFSPGAPRRAWVADISYIPTDEGWLYLAVVLDLLSASRSLRSSRKVVGWATRTTCARNCPWRPSARSPRAA